MHRKGIEIVVSKGRFDTVELAARSEKSVKWFVPDTDADAVTQCYGALELKTMLKNSTGPLKKILGCEWNSARVHKTKAHLLI